MQETDETTMTSLRPESKGRRGAEPQFFNLLVDGKVLFNIGIGNRNVGFRLVIVVIGDEELDCIFREELFEFAVKLCGQGFIVAEYKCWPVQFCDHVGDGKGFAGTGHTEQDLRRITALQPFNKLPYRFRLIAGGLKFGGQFKVQ